MPLLDPEDPEAADKRVLTKLPFVDPHELLDYLWRTEHVTISDDDIRWPDCINLSVCATCNYILHVLMLTLLLESKKILGALQKAGHAVGPAAPSTERCGAHLRHQPADCHVEGTDNCTPKILAP